VDFGLFPDARGTERNGQKRENQAQNRPGSAEGEVRKFPHEPSRTRGNTRDRPRKNPNSDELGFCIWWSRGDLNPRPSVRCLWIYMFSVVY
jgi:hypothetical protein